MCNRYRLEDATLPVPKLFDAKADVGNWGPGEVHPKSIGLLVREEEGERVANAGVWGFPLPQKSKVTGKPIKPRVGNNARSDNLDGYPWKFVSDKPAHRCLIPLTAWAEAQGKKGAMTETWLSLSDQPIFACAGLWRDSDEWGRCYTMVMTDAASAIAHVHDRMPVLLAPDDYDRWLQAPLEDVVKLCKPWQGDIAVEKTDKPWARRAS